MLPEPIGEVISSSIRPNGLEVQKVRVPLGVIFFIYESRPNVTADAAALCVKSGNAVILRGGKEAAHSNRRHRRPILAEAASRGRPARGCRATGRHHRPRGGRPSAGNARIYQPGDSARRRGADPPRGRRGPDAGHQALHRQLPRLRRPLGRPGHGRADRGQRQVPADGRVQRGRVAAGPRAVAAALAAARSARPWSSGGSRFAATRRTRRSLPEAQAGHARRIIITEYLGPIISVKVVDSLDEAIGHINRYGSQHTDAIVTRDLAAARQFAAADRQLGGDGQRQHAVQRRRRVRPGRRDRHQHRQVPRPRPVRAARS